MTALLHDGSTEESGQLIIRARAIVQHIRFLNYIFAVREAHAGVVLYASYRDMDIYSRVDEWQQTRKWSISPAMSDSEIVQTAFKLCITSFEHRCREAFTYRQARIFGPHFDVEDLVKLCLDGREDAGGRKAL